MTWDKYWDEHANASPFRDVFEFTGRKHLLKLFQSALEDSDIRAIVVSGARTIGKTRLILEAIHEKFRDVVIARDPLLVTSSSITSLLHNGHMTGLFLPDCATREVAGLVEYAIAQKSLKLIVEVHAPDELILPGYGQDERVCSIPVPPLTAPESAAILTASKKKFPGGLQSWILDQATGNPGLLILAAHNSREIIDTKVPLGEAVFQTITKRIRADLGSERLETLRALSLLDPFSLDKMPGNEIEILLRNLGMEEKSRSIEDDISVLKDRGYIRTGGFFAVVEPALLANGLANQAANSGTLDLLRLFSDLRFDGQVRLLKRVRTLQGSAINKFFEEVFGPHGLFHELDLSAAKLEFLCSVAGHVPEQTAKMLLSTLEAMNSDQRIGLLQRASFRLLWLLELLLVREATSELAVRCLALLGEFDETPTNLNPNARVLFRKSFHPFHPQLPLSFQKRLDLLKELIAPSNSVRLRLLALRAMETGLGHSVMVMSQHVPGPSPLARPDRPNLSEAFAYMDEFYDMIWAATESDCPRLSHAACAAVPGVIQETAFAGRGDKAVERFRHTADVVLAQKLSIPIADLCAALSLVIAHFQDPRPQEKYRAEWIEQLEEIKNRIDGELDFGTRLMRWASKWTHEDHEYEPTDSGGKETRGERELRRLAQEAVAEPALLTTDLVNWLQSSEAQKSGRFLSYLGREDSKGIVRSIIDSVGEKDSGASCFSEYYRGQTQTNPGFVGRHLEMLCGKSAVRDTGLVRAITHLPPYPLGLKLIKRLHKENRTLTVFSNDPFVLAGWIDLISSEDFHELLVMIAGFDLNNAVGALKLLDGWLRDGGQFTEVLKDLAAKCIIAATPGYGEDYACDAVASALARLEPPFGFGLFEQLLAKGYGGSGWKPVEEHGGSRFWQNLVESDADRSVRILLTFARNDPEIAWNAKERLDQEKLADSLILYARANESQAEVVCECISPDGKGFWPIAVELASRYPKSEKIRKALSVSRLFGRSSMAGPFSEYYERHAIQAEQLEVDPSVKTKNGLF